MSSASGPPPQGWSGHEPSAAPAMARRGAKDRIARPGRRRWASGRAPGRGGGPKASRIAIAPRRIAGLLLGAACVVSLVSAACSEVSDSVGSHAHAANGSGPEGITEAAHAAHGARGADELPGEHAGEHGVVHLTAEAIRRNGIRVEAAATGALRDSLEVPAQVQLNPDRVAHISSLVEGQLLEVGATTGDAVEAGQHLATLRSVILGQARADLRRTAALHEVATRNLARQRRLRGEGISSERSLLEAEFAAQAASAERDAARSRLRVFGAQGRSGSDLSLTSPIAGVVLERHATRGENVGPADTLFVIADTSRLWIIGRVYEPHVARVGLGMGATLELAAYPGRSWSGEVSYVASALDEETRALPVRVEIDNPDGALRPGLFGNLVLRAQASSEDQILVPDGAVQGFEGGSVVFVSGETPREFQARSVTLGRSSGGQVEILEGLESAERVVVAGAFLLKSELMRDALGEGHAH
ncbi:MAG: efflux RND transporter periplasmic adaptor subunit [Myxococcales bacterium]|nr:efflux RND transporter periplasmic adaptor subunit [Myxococcales bacterium]